MINIFQRKSRVIYILIIVGLILTLIIPVGSRVLAQEDMKHFSFVSSIYTSEFGVENPDGIAYSPDADSFIVWGADGNIHAIASKEEIGGQVTLPQNAENHLAVAFDQYSKSLFVLGAGNAEVSKIAMKPGGLPALSSEATRFNIESVAPESVGGMTFDPATGRLFILDTNKSQILIVSPHPVHGFDGVSAVRDNRIRRVNLNPSSQAALRGIAFNPNDGHLYVSNPQEQRIYELTEAGQQLSIYDIRDLHIEDPSALLFAPSRDSTDDPNIMDLYLLDSGHVSGLDSTLYTDQRSTLQRGQIVELSLQAPATLPPGTTLLPSTLVRTFDTSVWNHPSPDPSGIDYWPLTGRFLISDSEIEESVNGHPPVYWHGFNIFLSTLAGSLTGNCTTFTSDPVDVPPTYNNFSNEPTGVAINPTNNHIFFSNDGSNSRVFEVGPGTDNVYCTSDDTVTRTLVATLYGATDAEDVAYGNNRLFIADGINAEVYVIPLGANGVLGGGDDGPVTHFDTASLGFHDLEGIGYNSDAGTLFIVSTVGSENYLGEVTTSGTLVHAYDLSFMGTQGNLRSDVTYAPSSQNPAVKSIYIVSRGVDNNADRFENDGRVWEIRISTPVPTATPTLAPGSAHAKVYIGGALQNEYNISPQSSLKQSYDGVNDGPVIVQSTNGRNIVASERVAYFNGSNWTSHSELMGLPANQLTTSYIFPWYNNADINSQLRFANIGSASTTVRVYVGGILKGSYPLLPNESTRVSYNNLNDGPVNIQSSGNVPIIASLRVAYTSNGGATWPSFSEMMGLPANKLSNSYIFPWYNNKDLNSQLRFANVGTSQTTVTVRVGNQVKGNYTLLPNESQRVSYSGLDGGPVRVTSSNGVKIIASLRVAYTPNGGATWTNFSELMGLPVASLSSRYSFPIYNNVNFDTQLRFGNVGTAPTTVTVLINGVVKGTYTLSPNQSQRVSYSGLDSGPVVISSSGGVPIIASERVAYFNGSRWTSFSEMMGLPQSQLTTTYIFPWYNNVDLDTQLRFGVP